MLICKFTFTHQEICSQGYSQYFSTLWVFDITNNRNEDLVLRTLYQQNKLGHPATRESPSSITITSWRAKFHCLLLYSLLLFLVTTGGYSDTWLQWYLRTCIRRSCWFSWSSTGHFQIESHSYKKKKNQTIPCLELLGAFHFSPPCKQAPVHCHWISYWVMD